MITNTWRLAPPEIQTERLILRCPQEQDGPELYAAISESLAELQPWFAWTADLILTPENCIVTAARARERFLSAKEMQFYIFAKGESPLMGVCGLTKPDWDKLFFEICYWMRTQFVGHGYMTEAVVAVTQFALRNLQARRIEALCNPANEEGIAVVRHAGYVHEKIETIQSHHQGREELTNIVKFVRLA